MSGPAVAIGFILLIPSVLGMLFSALLFFGVIASTGGKSGANANESSHMFQSAFDASFRQSCARNFKRTYGQASGESAPQSLVEQYCECALSVYKETGSNAMAAQTCTQEATDGTLNTPSQDVDALYTNTSSHQNPDAAGVNLFRFLGSVSAVALGIASFVGGLLGWLLVMRKRVLQCNLCGAVVNAS
jgi:hypothetical protein